MLTARLISRHTVTAAAMWLSAAKMRSSGLAAGIQPACDKLDAMFAGLLIITVALLVGALRWR